MARIGRRNLTQRVEALEHGSSGHFAGYACVDVWEGQTVEEAKAAWEAENGAFGYRQIILWNIGGLSEID